MQTAERSKGDGTSRPANSGAGAAKKLSWVEGHFARNATKFREVHRAKRLALREPERSAGIRRSIEATAESIAGAPKGRRSRASEGDGYRCAAGAGLVPE